MRVELDRAEPAEDLEHGVGASLERPRRREDVPGDEKAARGLSGDLHAAGRYPIGVDVLRTVWSYPTGSDTAARRASSTLICGWYAAEAPSTGVEPNSAWAT